MKKILFWITAFISVGLITSGIIDMRKAKPMATPQEFLEPTAIFSPSPSSLPSARILPRPIENMAEVESESRMVILVNAERAKVGAGKLIEVSYVNAGALKRAKDIRENGQWSHIGYETAMRSTLKYPGKILAGENLARDCFSDQQVVGAWLNSPAHKAVMLDPKYKFVGFGNYQGICVLWVSNYK